MLFRNLNLKPWIQTTLAKLNLVELTPIQEEALPTVLNNKSAIITSQTGTGKTLCYLLPILNDINFETRKIQTIIVLPTKELARQVYSKVLDFKKEQSSLKSSLLIGNMDINIQQQQLRSNPPHIVIGTVTRVLDLLKNKTINRDVNKIVLDEVDMLLDLGFFNQINNIFSLINTFVLQKIACSATVHSSLANQLKKYFTNAKIFNTSTSVWANENIKHHLVYSNNLNNPMGTLLGLLKNINPYFCIIFANTKNIANEIYERLLNNGNNVTLLHKDLTTRQRKNIYQDVQNHNFQYLVATDLASRGLDIEGADVVISYGLPEDDIWYMHRIGRAGRANTNGDAYVIYDTGIDNRINRLTKKNIKWNYLHLSNDNQLTNKELKLRIHTKPMLDKQTNDQIKKIIGTQSQKVRPGYKRKIKQQIFRIKQKKRHEFIEKKIKQHLLMENIKRTKKFSHKRKDRY